MNPEMDPFAELLNSCAKQPETRPLLDRLVPSVVVKNIDAEKTQPCIGASVMIRGVHGEPLTVWLPAAAWEGMAAVIRQTPIHLRPSVAAFLEVLHACLVVGDPLERLVDELVGEVDRDPYGEMPQTPL